MLVKSLVAGTVLTLLAGGVVYYGTDVDRNTVAIPSSSKAAPSKPLVKEADADTTLHAEATSRHPHGKKTKARKASSDENDLNSSDIPSLKSDTQALIDPKSAAVTVTEPEDMPDNMEELSDASEMTIETMATEKMAENAASTEIKTEVKEEASEEGLSEDIIKAPQQTPATPAAPTPKKPGKKWIDQYLKAGDNKNADAPKDVMEAKATDDVSIDAAVDAKIDDLLTPDESYGSANTKAAEAPTKDMENVSVSEEVAQTADAAKDVMEAKAAPTSEPHMAKMEDTSIDETVNARIDALLLPNESYGSATTKAAEASTKQMENVSVSEEAAEKESVTLDKDMKTRDQIWENHDRIRKAHKDRLAHNLEEKIAEDGNIKMETKTIDLGDGKTMTIVERDQMDMPANADKGSKQIRIKVMKDEDIDLGAIPEVIKMGDGTKIKIRKQIMDSQDVDIDVSEMSSASDVSKTAQLIMAQAEKITMSELRDRAYLDLVSYALDNDDTQTANLAMSKIEQVELRDTARNRMAVAFAENGQAEKAFAILEDIEVEALRDIMRLQVIEALIAPQSHQPSNIQ